MTDLNDAQLLELFKNPQADLSLLTPDEQQRLVRLTDTTEQTQPAQPRSASLAQKMVDVARWVTPLGAVESVAKNPVAAGATAGGLLLAPLTGGASIPAAMAMTGLGAAGGAGATIAGRQLLTGKPESGIDTAKSMVGHGLAGAAGEGAGRAIAGGLRLAGRGLYRAAALPINKMMKYGDLIDEGLKQRVPVSKSGLAKAEGIKAGHVAEKKAALAGADQRASFVPSGIAADAEPALLAYAQAQAKAAQGNPMAKFRLKLDDFTQQNPRGTLNPSALEGIKSTLDDQLGGAYRKLRMREPLTPKEKVNMELSHASSRAQESVIPNYRELNRNVMNAEGLRQMIDRRVNPGSSGGNQGLENAMTLLGGLASLPGRIAMLPPVMSRGGIAANELSKGAAATLPTGLRALLAALVGDSASQQQQP